MSLAIVLIGVGCDGGGSQNKDGGKDAAKDAGTGGKVGTGGSVGTATGGSSAGGGVSGTGGVIVDTGGTVGTGGTAAGGATSTGGAAVGGSGTGGRGGAGGVATGGSAMTGGRGGAGTGGAATGGSAMTGGRGGAGTGGAATGGAATGGSATGGAATGGSATGGAATGGAATGGANTGGANTGGANTGGANTGGANTGGANTGGAGGGATTASMFVVAHPDDDVFFLNPEIDTDIGAGRRVRSVYMTSGDAGNPTQGATREVNIMKAYAAMADVQTANPWTCTMPTYAGKPVYRCVLAGSMVDLIFFRLPDGHVMELITDNATLTVAVPANATTTFTRLEVLATLDAVMSEVNPGKVGMLDATLAHGFEHVDHRASSMLTFDVARGSGVARALTMFRGYTMWEPAYMPPENPTAMPPPFPEAENLSSAQHLRKKMIYTVYDSFDPPPTDIADRWCFRFYPLRSVTSGPGPLRNNGGQCLEAAGTTSGSDVRLATCSGSAAQTWTATAAGKITGVNGLCLGIGTGSSIVVETCASAVDQMWTRLDDLQIHGQLDQCLTASGTDVVSATCAADTSSDAHWIPLTTQRWAP